MTRKNGPQRRCNNEGDRKEVDDIDVRRLRPQKHSRLVQEILDPDYGNGAMDLGMRNLRWKREQKGATSLWGTWR